MKPDPLVVEFVRQVKVLHPEEFPAMASAARRGLMGWGKRPADYGSWDLKRG